MASSLEEPKAEINDGFITVIRNNGKQSVLQAIEVMRRADMKLITFYSEYEIEQSNRSGSFIFVCSLL